MNAASTMALLRGATHTPAAQPVEAVYATAYELHQQEHYADAATVFRLMIRVAPFDGRAWAGLAECHEKLGQHSLARELFGAGMVTSRSPRCALGRARLLRTLDREDEATETLEMARELAGATDDDEVLDLIAHEEGSPS